MADPILLEFQGKVSALLHERRLVGEPLINNLGQTVTGSLSGGYYWSAKPLGDDQWKVAYKEEWTPAKHIMCTKHEALRLIVQIHEHWGVYLAAKESSKPNISALALHEHWGDF